MLRLDVKNSRELQATILAIRNAPKEIQKRIRDHTKQALLPEWQQGLREHADTRLQHRVLADTAKASVSNQNVRLASAGSAKRLSGGLSPSRNGRAVEFGIDPRKPLKYTRKNRKGGGSHTVNRRIGNAFGSRAARGNAVFPTAAALIPRFASLWIQTTVRTFYEALEGK